MAKDEDEEVSHQCIVRNNIVFLLSLLTTAFWDVVE